MTDRAQLDPAQGSPRGENSKRQKKPAARTPRRITESYLHNAGLHYLQRFAASTGQFRRVMRRKIDRSCAAHPDQDRESCFTLLEALIERFRQSGLLDDAAYVRGSVASMRRRGLSARMITAKLSAKGIAAAVTAQALQADLAEETEAVPADAELQAALKFARRKKIGPFDLSPRRDPEEKRRRAMGALSRAGYAFETVRQVLGSAAGPNEFEECP